MYVAKQESYYGIGGGVNGTGKRPKKVSWSVFSPSGRRVRVFDGPRAEIAAREWAAILTEREAA